MIEWFSENTGMLMYLFTNLLPTYNNFQRVGIFLLVTKNGGRVAVL